MDEAIPYLKRATERNPEDATAWKALGAAYAANQQFPAAEPAFAKACSLAPRLENACYYQARTLYVLNRFDEALEVLRRSRQKGWKFDLAMGQNLYALGRAEEAEPLLRKAVAGAHGADPGPGVELGTFLQRQGRSEEAGRELAEVVRRFPKSGEARLQLGRTLLDRGDTAGAIEQLEQAVALAPDSAQAHLLLANAYVRAGRTADAQPHFAAARAGAQ